MIHVAIIGAGIGAEHLDGYEALPNEYAVKTLCDLDLDKAANVVGNRDIAICDSFEDVLLDPQIDLVDICLPPHLHFTATAQALEAGKHVICEKPLAGSVAEVDALTELAQKVGKTLTPVFQYRYGIGFEKLRALKAAGLTGKSYLASVETHWQRGSDYYAPKWRGTWAGEGGGATLIHAIHNHDLLCAVFGPISTVAAMTATRVNPIETEDCAVVNFEFGDGALATSSVTLGAAGDMSRFRFCFEHVTVESGIDPYAPGLGVWTFTATDPQRQHEIDAIVKAVTAGPSGFAGFFKELALSLSGTKSRPVTASDGRASIELVSAIYHSVMTGQKVVLPLNTDHPIYNGWPKPPVPVPASK